MQEKKEGGVGKTGRGVGKGERGLGNRGRGVGLILYRSFSLEDNCQVGDQGSDPISYLQPLKQSFGYCDGVLGEEQVAAPRLLATVIENSLHHLKAKEIDVTFNDATRFNVEVFCFLLLVNK